VVDEKYFFISRKGARMNRVPIPVTLLILFLSVGVWSAQGAVDMFIKVEGIPGESKDSTHADEIDVLSWSWGMSQSGTMHTGGGGAGKVSIQDLSITKYVDKSTPKLMLACSKGEHIPEATLTVRKAGTDPVEFLVITLTDVLVTSVSTGGSGGEDRLTENVTLNFGKVDVTYTESKPDGSKETHPPYRWDIVAEKEY
jgi:type VI secretion system secreted protein Hcp